jgi:hypothetical protein
LAAISAGNTQIINVWIVEKISIESKRCFIHVKIIILRVKQQNAASTSRAMLRSSGFLIDDRVHRRQNIYFEKYTCGYKFCDTLCFKLKFQIGFHDLHNLAFITF